MTNKRAVTWAVGNKPSDIQPHPNLLHYFQVANADRNCIVAVVLKELGGNIGNDGSITVRLCGLVQNMK
jgi:hypothetical protein